MILHPSPSISYHTFIYRHRITIFNTRSSSAYVSMHSNLSYNNHHSEILVEQLSMHASANISTHLKFIKLSPTIYLCSCSLPRLYQILNRFKRFPESIVVERETNDKNEENIPLKFKMFPCWKIVRECFKYKKNKTFSL